MSIQRANTAVSRSTQEQTYLSPSAGLRMEGLSTLSLWDLILVFLELSHLSAQLRTKN